MSHLRLVRDGETFPLSRSPALGTPGLGSPVLPSPDLSAPEPPAPGDWLREAGEHAREYLVAHYEGLGPAGRLLVESMTPDERAHYESAGDRERGRR